jgi:hypothetical protein
MKKDFSLIGERSFIKTLIILFQLSLGTTAFTLPVKYCKVSLIIGILISLIVSIITRLTMQMILNLGNKYSINIYYELIKKILGEKLAKFFRYIIVINTLLGFTLYISTSKQ